MPGMNDNSAIPESGKTSHLRIWLLCGALLFGGVMGFRMGMSQNQIRAVAPIVVGLIMLSLISTKLPMLKPIFVGMGLGAALLSLFNGQWASALKAAQQYFSSKATPDKSD